MWDGNDDDMVAQENVLPQTFPFHVVKFPFSPQGCYDPHLWFRLLQNQLHSDPSSCSLPRFEVNDDNNSMHYASQGRFCEVIPDSSVPNEKDKKEEGKIEREFFVFLRKEQRENQPTEEEEPVVLETDCNSETFEYDEKREPNELPTEKEKKDHLLIEKMCGMDLVDASDWSDKIVNLDTESDPDSREALTQEPRTKVFSPREKEKVFCEYEVEKKPTSAPTTKKQSVFFVPLEGPDSVRFFQARQAGLPTSPETRSPAPLDVTQTPCPSPILGVATIDDNNTNSREQSTNPQKNKHLEWLNQVVKDYPGSDFRALSDLRNLLQEATSRTEEVEYLLSAMKDSPPDLFDSSDFEKVVKKLSVLESARSEIVKVAETICSTVVEHIIPIRNLINDRFRILEEVSKQSSVFVKNADLTHHFKNKQKEYAQNYLEFVESFTKRVDESVDKLLLQIRSNPPL
jgi:hypothetical protein